MITDVHSHRGGLADSCGVRAGPRAQARTLGKPLIKLYLGKGKIYKYLKAGVNSVELCAFQAYPQYAFDYAVKDPHTGDHKTQWEKRDGDLVKGI